MVDVAPDAQGVSLVGDQVVAYPGAISPGVSQSAPSIPVGSRDSFNSGPLAQPAVEGNAQRGRPLTSVESLARVAEAARAAVADGATEQSVVSYLTNVLAQGTHSAPHNMAAPASVAPPVQRQFQVQAADGGWARGYGNASQDGALLPSASGDNVANSAPAPRTGGGVADAQPHPALPGAGSHAAAVGTAAAAAETFTSSEEMKMLPLARMGHKLTFAGERDAHRLMEFLGEKENTLKPYLRAGRLMWERPGDRITVMTWLGSALEGTAKTWWDSTVDRINESTGQMESPSVWETLMDWEQVVAAFKAQWERAVDIAAVRGEFYQGTKQRPGESVPDYNARFDRAAARAKVTTPNLLANTYWWGLRQQMRDEIIRHLHVTKGEAAAARADDLSMPEMKALAREVMLLGGSARPSSHGGSGMAPSSQPSRGGMHVLGAEADDYDEEGGEPYEDHNQLHQEGLINTVNANGGRNKHNVNSYTYNHSMTVERGAGTGAGGPAKRRKVGQPVTAGGGGRNRYSSSSPSPSSSGSGTPRRWASAGKPPSYRSAVDGKPNTGGNGGLTHEQVQQLQAMRQKMSGVLDKVPDGQLFARLQQRVCLLCGNSNHRVNACPSAPAAGVKKEHPKGQARGGQQ